MTENENSFFENVQKDFFPWYYLGSSLQEYPGQESNITSRNLVYTHACMHRDPSDKPVRGLINSEFAETTENFFLRICQENDIKVNTIFRMVYNATFYSPDEYDHFHRDHFFDHKVFIFYINKFNKGSTYIKDSNDIIEIKSDKNKVVIFDDCEHAQGFCELFERRVVLVVTFQ